MYMRYNRYMITTCTIIFPILSISRGLDWLRGEKRLRSLIQILDKRPLMRFRVPRVLTRLV
jgi:hypothetical protein